MFRLIKNLSILDSQDGYVCFPGNLVYTQWESNQAWGLHNVVLKHSSKSFKDNIDSSDGLF